MEEYKRKNAFTKENLTKVFDFAEDYKKFLDSAKTEREAVKEALRLVENKGYKSADLKTGFKSGGKYYIVNKSKVIAVINVGENPIEKGVKMVAAHIDSPRLDLKQVPLYEDSGTAYLKTHYYGGIRKYQWFAIPLALHGVVTLLSGKNVEINIGEKADDPIFYISDLLPHLAHNDDKKSLGDAFVGEKMNVICGGLDFGGDKKVKTGVLDILKKNYGIEEEDFLSAEIEVVPTYKCRDVGFDRAYIAGYGHDDRVCAYSSLAAILDSKNKDTSVVFLVDKEEIGSEGVSGAQSRFIMDVLDSLSKSLGGDFATVRANSVCVSADVSAGFDSNFKEVYESNNSAYISKGVALNKYTGSRGKSGSNDASAELVAYFRRIFKENNVVWQSAELGKIDEGGGGTVAKFFSKENIDTIDIGVPVISMHSPFELISKADLYSAYMAYKAFFEN